ncbi:MAG: hypothetical protein QXN21_03045 [Candidatus Bathyarchaeia archaeon]
MSRNDQKTDHDAARQLQITSPRNSQFQKYRVHLKSSIGMALRATEGSLANMAEDGKNHICRSSPILLILDTAFYTEPIFAGLKKGEGI